MIFPVVEKKFHYESLSSLLEIRSHLAGKGFRQPRARLLALAFMLFCLQSSRFLHSLLCPPRPPPFAAWREQMSQDKCYQARQ